MPPKTRKALLLLISLVTISLSASSLVAGQSDGYTDTPQRNISANSVLSVVDNETAPAISICSQHAPKCPLTAASWPGEPDGWQYTGKKWIWVPGTKNVFNRTTVWEYSQPYSGSTPEYQGQREDRYASCSGDPQDCSFFNGTPPTTYDWERYMQVGDNFKVMQLGNFNEAESYLIGDVDCESGIFYPVVDHNMPFTYTLMHTNRWKSCTGGGYVAAYLSEQWGEPLSQERIALCDNATNGVPASLSQAGNNICKISPHVGVVFQRYIFGAASPAELPSVGCEAVLYAWGWSEPHSPVTGQDYQTWFRNGELRFTRWYDLSIQVSLGNIPTPDDHDWWDSRCQSAWTEEGNWLYTGTFRVGNAEYRDQAMIEGPRVYLPLISLER